MSPFSEAFPQRNRAYWSYTSHSTSGMILGFPTMLDPRRNVCVSWAPHPSETDQDLTDILENCVSPSVLLITHVLSSQVRPAFQSHVHPKVNPSTGRVLSRVAGGSLASQDLYASQSWKEYHPGIFNVLLWVVAHIKVKASHIPCSAYTRINLGSGLRQSLASGYPAGHDFAG